MILTLLKHSLKYGPLYNHAIISVFIFSKPYKPQLIVMLKFRMVLII